jgi:nucleoid DNA-binding protein
MTETEFYRKIAEKSGITYSGVEEVMNAFVEVFRESVQKRQSFVITNIGSLGFSKVKKRQSSKLLGSKTLPETDRVFFHLSTHVKKLLKTKE